MDPYRYLTWWYRLVTVPLLATGLWVRPATLYLAVAVCGIQVLHFTWRNHRCAAFPVYMAMSYLGLLVVGLWEPLSAIHWIQLIATTASVVFCAGPLREPSEPDGRRDAGHAHDVVSARSRQPAFSMVAARSWSHL
jgi:hypothetical protein